MYCCFYVFMFLSVFAAIDLCNNSDPNLPNLPKLNGLFFRTQNIPAIIINGFTDAFQIERLISTIDFPVDNIFIGIQTQDPGLECVCERLKRRYPKIVQLISFGEPIGNAAGINDIMIRFKPKWALIVPQEIIFSKGTLQKLYKTANTYPNKIIRSDNNIGVFVLPKVVFDQMGLLDENLFPRFCEGTDYMERAIRLGFGPILGGFEVGINFNTPETKQLRDEEYLSMLARGYRCEMYLKSKWGENYEYEKPFDIEEAPVSFWKYEIARRYFIQWGVLRNMHKFERLSTVMDLVESCDVL
eukprot:TRINITY_DN2596_c0_g1_i2.p1 TRINITY_DN2596_c0_g1~~TRINITY_DN2596_c0_g1_i2.p1  ORF type:complete len:300 (-),score=59.97 TRINITY_DN2596_c0_g1_i2:55-954(-)